jgi:cytochrome c biogenesis protein CcmG/thiol:disulfide interchange protein DsbE
MSLRFAVPLAVFLGLAALFGIGLLKTDPTRKQAALNNPAPAFTLQPIAAGQAPFTRADLEGKVTLIHVFASWCSTCAAEVPVIREIAARTDAAIYGVAWVDGPGKAAAWLARHGNPYDAVGDDPTGKLGADLGVTGTPETFVIDAAGLVRHHQVGPISPDIWMTQIGPLVEALQAEARDTAKTRARPS